MEKTYISYKDDDNKIIKGYFEIIKETESKVEVKTDNNIITIPFHRILKIKRKLKGGN